MTRKNFFFQEEDITNDRIEVFLKEVSNDFAMPLDARVDIAGYSKKLHQRAKNIFLVSDNQDVGHVAIYFNNNVAFISSIAVLKEYTGVGFGGELLQKVRRLCIYKMVQEIQLRVSTKSAELIRFYEANGFYKEALLEDRQEFLMKSFTE